jgi:hypothetical protein
MSITEARIPIEAARAGGQEAWLELLAPDREPRLQPYGHAAVARQPRLPHLFDKEMVSPRSDS